MIVKKRHRTGLPPKFDTYIEFYKELRKHISETTRDFEYHDFIDGTTYVGTLEYVKSKCWDEFIEAYPELSRVNPSGYDASFAIDRIDHFVGYSRFST